MQLFRSAGTLARQTGQVVASTPIRFLLRWPVYAILLAAMAGCGGDATPAAIPLVTEDVAPPVLSAAPSPTATDVTATPVAAATVTAQMTATVPPPGPTKTAVRTGIETLLDGTWSEGAPMPTARSEMPAALLDGLIYLPGGFGGEQALEAYDPAADRWHSLAPMPEGRHHLMAAAHAGRVYIFGGARSGGWEPSATARLYDPAEDSWAVSVEGRMGIQVSALGTGGEYSGVTV